VGAVEEGSGNQMAIMPHCVVCGYSTGTDVAGSVEFADYHPSWRPPFNSEGYPLLGWSNSLGVTAPDGVGLFCREHLPLAKKLRRLRADEAVARLRAGGHPAGILARLRNLLR
jgi:hypothetical protein